MAIAEKEKSLSGDSRKGKISRLRFPQSAVYAFFITTDKARAKVGGRQKVSVL